MQPMTSVNRDLSEQVAGQIRIEPGLCWRNAARALDQPGLAGAVYVEGMAVALNRLLALEHGWLELDGAVVDPTLWTTPTAYFPALRLTGPELGQRLAAGRQLPVFRRLEPGSRDGLAFEATRLAAVSYARAAVQAARAE